MHAEQKSNGEIVERKSYDIDNLKEQFELLAKFNLPPIAACGSYVVRGKDGSLILRNRINRIDIFETDDGLRSISQTNKTISEKLFGNMEIKTSNRAVIENVLCCSIEPGEFD